MGLFSQQPEHNEEWAGLPSEPLRPESDAERLADAAPVDVAALGVSVSGLTPTEISVGPVIDLAEIADEPENHGVGERQDHSA